ncbi:hypothetical protein ACIQPR_18325 [Streptomyces sp. NPDC091280]|uniref:hypothetical protein n=1 Tax=Streptomyces sp. NPDC091280 TaxID=3365984 RepID=UPI003801B357
MELARRSVPTPGDLMTARCPAAADPAPPADPRPVAPYDRHRWEEAVMSGDLYRDARLLALVLAHHAGESGVLPEDGIQYLRPLSRLTDVTPRLVKLALRDLQRGGYMWRPPLAPGAQTQIARPITLTLPPVAARTEPPHTGEVPSAR